MREIEPVLDLQSIVSEATRQTPVREIVLGTPQARRHMVHGFREHRRRLPGKATAAWSVDDGAELEFFVGRPRDIELSFRCAPVRRTDFPLVTIELRLGGKKIFEQQLRRGMHEYRVQLPAEALAPGENRLEISHLGPGPPHSRARHQRRVLWEWLRFEPAEAVGPLGESPRGLFVPSAARLDFFVDLQPRARLQIDEVVSRRHRSPLSVHWQPLDGPATSWEVPSGTPTDLELTDRSASGRLSFGAPLDTPALDEQVGGLLLLAPKLTGARQDSAPVAESRPHSTTPPTRPPNIVVYLIDTLRADHLGAYGYPRDTSPNIDRFAEQAVLFDNSQAQSSWTRASVGSILTGLWPQEHGAIDRPDALAEELDTLPERLQQAGYLTAAFVANGNASDSFGFEQGFEHFEFLVGPPERGRKARSHEVNEAVFAFLDEHRDEERPLFLWIHTIDPHAPYIAPESFQRRISPQVISRPEDGIGMLRRLQTNRSLITEEVVERLVDLYDAEIAANDDAFGQLLEQLRARGLYEDSVVALLSDHGEEFLEHGGLEHGQTLHSEQLDTPLILRAPGLESGERRSETAQHIDLAPTLLDLAGAAPLAAARGRSLSALLEGGPTDWSHEAVAHLQLDRRRAESFLDATGRYKVIVNRRLGAAAYPLLYDRSRDRSEFHDLARHGSSLRARHLEATLRRRVTGLQRIGPAGTSKPSPESIEQLRALGYLQ